MSSSYVGNEFYLKTMEMQCLNSRKALEYLSRSWPKKPLQVNQERGHTSYTTEERDCPF